jgi:hypothetical protein
VKAARVRVYAPPGGSFGNRWSAAPADPVGKYSIKNFIEDELQRIFVVDMQQAGR